MVADSLMTTETPFTGGNLTPSVVRVGDTVRRPRTASSDFSQKLLKHLEANGFRGVPRHLGVDEKNRDILSYIPGETKWRPLTDEQVQAGGRLLRAFHDATRGSELGGSHPVVCHGDPGPNNAIFQDGLPVAWIDFDLAAPGDPIKDVAWMAWFWCITIKTERLPVERQAEQVRLLLDAYGLKPVRRRELPEAIYERMAWNVEFFKALRLEGTNLTADKVDAVIEGTKQEEVYVRENEVVLFTSP